MEITHEERLKFLKAYNDLRHILQTLWECQDLWMSDMRKLEDLQCTMHRVMKFVPQQDDDGRSMHYSDWVLAELDNEDI